MATKPAEKKLLQEAVDLLAAHGSYAEANRMTNVPISTLKHRVASAKAEGIEPKVTKDENKDAKIKRLEAALKNAEKQSSETAEIKAVIGAISERVTKLDIPDFIIQPREKNSAPGVPTLFLSDLHWGEVVHRSQIGGVNEYNLRIAHERMEHTVASAITLLKILSPQMDYPGIVMPLGGDMISGNIHEELATSNELPTMPTVLDLFGVLTNVIEHVADTFKQVFLPCVTGNHGRDTHKIYAKNRQHTSFDWLLYQFLARHFAKDKRVQFYIPDGPDAYYRIYNHRYLLTHGDQFRGGDGMIGALGPIIRGDHKKRSRNAQIDQEYDTMEIGHWHQDIFLRRLIVNGSMKGYDEYANQSNFGYEPPTQQLWVTHQRNRISFRAPVLCDRQQKPIKTEWVSLPKAA